MVKWYKNVRPEYNKRLNGIGMCKFLSKNLFAKREVSKRRKSNLEIASRKTVKYRDKSIRSLEPHIWNGLPEEIKNENSYDKFKECLNTWHEPKCTCSLCFFTEINT